jgi:hypothetical protein
VLSISRRAVAATALALVFPLTACFPEAPSLHPLFDAADALPKAEIEGEWVAEGKPDERLQIESAGDFYELRLFDGDCTPASATAGPECPIRLSARFGRLSGERFMDFTAKDAPLSLPVHHFSRVRLRAGRLEIAMVNQEWLSEAITGGQIALAHEVRNASHGQILITAPTEDLQRVIGAWAFAPEAFDAPTLYVRPGAAGAETN